MGMVRANIAVDGMTCRSCEALIERTLSGIPGVASVRARVRGGSVEVLFDESRTGVPELEAAIEMAGYSIRRSAKTGATVAIGVGVILSALYLLAASRGVFNAIPSVDASIGYAMLFVVGLLTSVHCVAMCGGIALSQSFGREREESRFRRLIPGLQYNAGRAVAYTAIGGVAGALGSAIGFSPAVRGAIAAVAGFFMIILGLRMIGVLKGFPSLARFAPAHLLAAGKRIASALRSRGPFAIGILNGFMPCGPLQTMQLYALGTGSALAGALSLFTFAIGTIPLLFIFGLTAALLPRKFLPRMIQASAVLVMVLGAVTLVRAAALAGVALPSFAGSSAVAAGSAGIERRVAPAAVSVAQTVRAPAGPVATVKDGVQYVTTEFSGGRYVPFTVQAGLPLKWTIRVRPSDLNGCNNPVEVPGYGIQKRLAPGDNLIEFTPTKEGVIPYSCWMGMVRSRITVVKDIAGSGVAEAANGASFAETAGLSVDEESVGCPCCAGTSIAQGNVN